MSDLQAFRDHCRAMADPGAHRDDCVATITSRWGATRLKHPDPACCGCVPDKDRDLFTRLADEIDEHLFPPRPPARGFELGLFEMDEAHALTNGCTEMTCPAHRHINEELLRRAAQHQTGDRP